MVSISRFKTDSSIETSGVTVEVLPGLTVKLRSTTTSEYRRRSAELYRPLSKMISAGMMVSPEKQDEILATLLAEVIIVGWSGLDDENGAPIEFTKAKALELMASPDYRQLRDIVYDLASTPETFRALPREEAVGNSPPASSGNSNGA